MVATLLGGLGASAILNGIGSDTNPMFAMTPIQHLVTGGFAFGLVFMATDPVSASMTSGGKWIYGLLIGVIACVLPHRARGRIGGGGFWRLAGQGARPGCAHHIYKINIDRNFREDV